MNLMFLFSQNGIPMLFPAHICQFDKEKGIYVAEDKEKNKELADVGCLSKIDHDIYNIMYGTKFNDYCIIDIVSSAGFSLKVCFFICNNGSGENKFVIFCLNSVSLSSIRDSGLILTQNILIGCGVSKHNIIDIFNRKEGSAGLYNYVEQRNLLKNELYELQVFVYPKGFPMGSYKRVVEDKRCNPYFSLPLIQKSIAMLFCQIFDIQLLGPLVDSMDEKSEYKLKFFDESGHIFYHRTVNKYNVSRTIVVNSVDIMKSISR